MQDLQSLKQVVLGTKARLSQQQSLKVRRLKTSPMQRLRQSSMLLGQSTIQPHSMEQRHWNPRAQMLPKLLVQMRLILPQRC
jgi:hypothetical protein